MVERCDNCNRIDELAGRLIWAACHGLTRERMVALVGHARRLLERLPHDSGCEEGSVEGAPCACARGRALAGLAIPEAPPAPPLRVAELLTPREALLVDELLGREAALLAKLRAVEERALRAEERLSKAERRAARAAGRRRR